MKTQVNEVLKKYLNENKAKEYSTKLFPIDKSNNRRNKNRTRNLSMAFALQIKAIINDAEIDLSEEELYSLLYNLSKISLDENDFQLASEINNQILNRSSQSSNLANISSYAILKLGKIYFQQNDLRKSLEYAETAKTLFKEQKDFKGLFRSDFLLGNIYFSKGELDKSKFYFEEATKFLNHKSDFHQTVILENKLGEIEYLMGNYDQAHLYFNRMQIKFEQIENPEKTAIAHIKMGLVFLKKNNSKAALLEFNKSLYNALKTKNHFLIAKVYLNKAKVYLEEFDYNLGIAYLDKANQFAERINDRSILANIFILKGLFEKRQRNFENAELFIRKSLKLNEELGNISNTAAALNELGKLFLEQNQNKEAFLYFEDASKFYKKAGSSVFDSQINDFSIN